MLGGQSQTSDSTKEVNCSKNYVIDAEIEVWSRKKNFRWQKFYCYFRLVHVCRGHGISSYPMSLVVISLFSWILKKFVTFSENSKFTEVWKFQIFCSLPKAKSGVELVWVCAQLTRKGSPLLCVRKKFPNFSVLVVPDENLDNTLKSDSHNPIEKQFKIWKPIQNLKMKQSWKLTYSV